MRIISALPYSWQLKLGGGIGRIGIKLAHSRRHIAEINLATCFPELTPQQRNELLKKDFIALGIGLFETVLAWWGSDKKLSNLVQIEGLEHFDQAMAQGKGVILLTGHFTHLELGARFFALHRPFHAMYRPHKNLLYETIVRQARERRSRRRAFTRDDIRGMLRAFRQGEAVWYAPDQNYGSKHSIFVPFFEEPALTITATSRLARMSGAAVVPYFPERMPGKAGYRLTILPALEDFPSGNDHADALRINQLIEEWIRRVPEQYLWVHRRFKTRPPGYPAIYHKQARAISN
jgi:KDO2-lipid IV(A) lauroyltransferase